jgi:hypothetical protein
MPLRMVEVMCWYWAAMAVLDHPMIPMTARSGTPSKSWSYARETRAGAASVLGAGLSDFGGSLLASAG